MNVLSGCCETTYRCPPPRSLPLLRARGGQSVSRLGSIIDELTRRVVFQPPALGLRYCTVLYCCLAASPHSSKSACDGASLPVHFSDLPTTSVLYCTFWGIRSNLRISHTNLHIFSRREAASGSGLTCGSGPGRSLARSERGSLVFSMPSRAQQDAHEDLLSFLLGERTEPAAANVPRGRHLNREK